MAELKAASASRLRRAWTGVPLTRAYQGRANSFGLLRLVFAFAVLVNHSAILGYGHALSARVDIGSLAVSGFFVVSGFLITRSARNTNVLRYFWHRAVRILPALWVCLLVTGLIVAPIIWWLEYRTMDGQWRSTGGVVDYVVHNWWRPHAQFGINDLLLNTPYGQLTHASVFNGSLWSLSYEIACYQIIGALAALTLLKRGRWLLLGVGLVLAAVLLRNDYHGTQTWQTGMVGPFPLVESLDSALMLWLGFVFLLGTLAALYADRIPINDVLGWASVVVAGVLVGTHNWNAAAAVPFAYAILWTAVRLPSAMQRVGQSADYSYGVYVYAFPVQQVLAYAGVNHAGMVGYTVITTIVTGVLAYASWHVVEKHALRLKDWDPLNGRSLADSWATRPRPLAAWTHERAHTPAPATVWPAAELVLAEDDTGRPESDPRPITS